MLNLTIAMNTAHWLISFILIWKLIGAPFLQTEKPSILSPQDGQVLQGVVEITGSTALDGFQEAEIEFGYQEDPSNTWFLIAQSKKPVEEGSLAQWDTSTISDGVYRLRVVVRFSDGSQSEKVVENLRVRNYLPIETAAATSINQKSLSTQALTLTSTQMRNTPTALPQNLAQLQDQELYKAGALGAFFVLVIVLLLGSYLGIRNWLKRR